MSHYPQAEPSERSSETDPYQTLHLLPSAPKELIVEVYWHLVHQLQAAAREDPRLRGRLDQVNDAYAAVVDPDARAEYEADRARSPEAVDGAKAAGSRTGMLRRLWKREPVRSSPKRSPWQMLHLDPNAPLSIAELSYSFCRLRLRSQWGDSAVTELEKLQEAYEALQTSEPDSPSEPEVAEPGADAGAAEASLPETAGGAETVAAPSAATDAEPHADAVEVGDPDKEKAHLGLPRAWRSFADLSASFGRWTRAGASAGWERLFVLLKDRAADPFHEYRSDAPAPDDAKTPHDAAESEPHPNVGERLAALSASSVKPPDPQPSAPEVADDSATSVQGVEGRPDEAAAEPPTEPTITPTLRSETIPQAQPSDVVQSSEVLAHLVAEADSAPEVSAVIGPRPFTIGTGPTCDVVLTSATTNGREVAARIWAHEGRFMLHALAATPAILVNGQPVVWAVLDDGDRLQIGDNVFRFRRLPGNGGGD